jgi:hypothetical protein
LLFERNEIEIQKTSPYEIAEHQNRRYVQDNEFRLMFLRSELFNVHKATRRMMKFLQHKVMYFGEEKLGKVIEWSDLTKDDIDVLKSNLWHVQKDPDRSGRPLCIIPSHVYMGNYKVENIVSFIFRFGFCVD